MNWKLVHTIITAALLFAAFIGSGLVAQEETTEARMIDRARDIAQPFHWPELRVITSEDVIPAELTSDEAVAMADEIIADQVNRALPSDLAAWLCWHLVAMDAEDFLEDGFVDHREDEITDYKVKFLLYEKTDSEWIEDRGKIGYQVAKIIARKRDPENLDALVADYVGTAQRSDLWKVDLVRYAATLSLDDQVEVWDSELSSLMALKDLPQSWLDEITNRLVALSIRQKVQG